MKPGNKYVCETELVSPCDENQLDALFILSLFRQPFIDEINWG